jgi:hypothetical protein
MQDTCFSPRPEKQVTRVPGETRDQRYTPAFRGAAKSRCQTPRRPPPEAPPEAPGHPPPGTLSGQVPGRPPRTPLPGIPWRPSARRDFRPLPGGPSETRGFDTLRSRMCQLVPACESSSGSQEFANPLSVPANVDSSSQRTASPPCHEANAALRTRHEGHHATGLSGNLPDRGTRIRVIVGELNVAGPAHHPCSRQAISRSPALAPGPHAVGASWGRTGGEHEDRTVAWFTEMAHASTKSAHASMSRPGPSGGSPLLSSVVTVPDPRPPPRAASAGFRQPRGTPGEEDPVHATRRVV